MFARVRAELERARSADRLSALTAVALVVIPWALLVFVGTLLAVSATRSLGTSLLMENGPVELATFLAFLTGGVMGLILAHQARGRPQGPLIARWYRIWAILFLVAAMEEISWGQWIFGFKPPAAIQAVNMQKELNLHNLPGVEELDEYLVLGAGLAGLVGVRWSGKNRLGLGVPAILASSFLAITVTTGLDLLTYQFSIQKRFDEILVWLIEVVEMLLGLSGMLYVWLNARRLHGQWSRADSGRAENTGARPAS